MIRSSGRLLLSRIGQLRQPYSPVALRFASNISFYTSYNPIASEERRGVWNVVKNYLGWNEAKQEVHVIVPEAEAYVIERDGKYLGTLTQGNHSLIPTRDKVAYVHSLKEQTISIPDQPALTKDYVTISIVGSLCVKIVDPKLVSYAVNKPMQSVTELARTKTCYEMSKMTLDETFEKRDILNARILMGISDIAQDWGFDCLHYEIRDLILPTELKELMERHAVVLREKSALLMASQAEMQAMRTARILATKGHEFGN